MRSFAPAVLICLALAAIVGGWLIAAAARGGSTADAPAPTPPSFAASAPPTPQKRTAPPAIDNDAPARHARRTACVKEAKSKRLAGARLSAYVKSCIKPSA